MSRHTPSFKTLRSSSAKATRALSGSKSINTKCELLLQSALRKLGLRFRKNVKKLPGKPDIVFPSQRLAIFCDGDFWHGKNWAQRKSKLKRGSNAAYWVAKIESNVNRDKRHTRDLKRLGWKVFRLWESDVLLDPRRVAAKIAKKISADC